MYYMYNYNSRVQLLYFINNYKIKYSIPAIISINTTHLLKVATVNSSSVRTN